MLMAQSPAIDVTEIPPDLAPYLANLDKLAHAPQSLHRLSTLARAVVLPPDEWLPQEARVPERAAQPRWDVHLADVHGSDDLQLHLRHPRRNHIRLRNCTHARRWSGCWQRK